MVEEPFKRQFEFLFPFNQDDATENPFLILKRNYAELLESGNKLEK